MWGAKPPTFLNAFPAPRGRPDLKSAPPTKTGQIAFRHPVFLVSEVVNPSPSVPGIGPESCTRAQNWANHCASTLQSQTGDKQVEQEFQKDSYIEHYATLWRYHHADPVTRAGMPPSRYKHVAKFSQAEWYREVVKEPTEEAAKEHARRLLQGTGTASVPYVMLTLAIYILGRLSEASCWKTSGEAHHSKS